MSKSLDEILNTNVEPKSLAIRREFPDLLRDIVAGGAEIVQIRIDAKTALNIANDIEFAVKYRTFNKETTNEEETSDSGRT